MERRWPNAPRSVLRCDFNVVVLPTAERSATFLKLKTLGVFFGGRLIAERFHGAARSALA